MFALGDVIPARPSLALDAAHISEGTVIYIHPMGRYYTLQFHAMLGDFCESWAFTPDEIEAGLRQGLFPKLQFERDLLAAAGIDINLPLDKQGGRTAYSRRAPVAKPSMPLDLALM